MTGEKPEFSQVRDRRGLRRLAAASAGVFLLASCTSTIGVKKGDRPTHSRATIAPRVVTTITGWLNYDGLTADNTCIGGGERPCFAPIRKTPHFDPAIKDPTINYLNAGTFDAGGNYTSVSWPFEGGNGKPADTFSVVCRVQGEDVYGTDPRKNSRVWDAVQVPAGDSRSGRQVVGYMPERWVRLDHNLAIESCSGADNPDAATLVTTPTH